MENKGLTFENLLDELKNNSVQITRGSYTFKELTHKQQRKILNGNFDPVEIPAKLSNIYTEYISDSVYLNDDMSDIIKITTVDRKPFFINMLRVVTFGNIYYQDGIGYELYDVQASDLVSDSKPHTITANKFKINLRIPTLIEEEKYNNLLVNALSPYKNKSSIDNINMGAVADVYQNYELLKYITGFEFNGQSYRFAQYSIQDRLKFLNNLSQTTVEEIKEYIDTNVKKAEDLALTAIDPATGDKIIGEINMLFFSSTTRNDVEHPAEEGNI